MSSARNYTLGSNDSMDDTEVDHLAAAGVFARLGRNDNAACGEHAGTDLGTRCVGSAAIDAVAAGDD